MFREMAQDHVILYLMLMAIFGLIMGFVGTLLIAVIIYWQRVTLFVYDMLSMGWG